MRPVNGGHALSNSHFFTRSLTWWLVCVLACFLACSAKGLSDVSKEKYTAFTFISVFFGCSFANLNLLWKDPCNAFLAGIFQAWGLSFVSRRQRCKKNDKDCVEQKRLHNSVKMKQCPQLKSQKLADVLWRMGRMKKFWDHGDLAWEGSVSTPWWHRYHGADATTIGRYLRVRSIRCWDIPKPTGVSKPKPQPMAAGTALIGIRGKHKCID